MKNYNIVEELEKIEKVIKEGPFFDDWRSLSGYRIPKWYKKLRFGIFIHYGLFTVPAYDTEWYPRMMYIKDSKAYKHHIQTYGEHNKFGYKDFIPMFKAEKFDADRWAKIFKSSGAQYVIPVSEHHDGFQMYASELSSYNAVDMGPHRNIVGELKESVEKEGLIFGTSSHRIEHYFFLGEGRDFDSDIKGDFKRGDFYWPSVKGPKDFDACSGECPPSEEFMQDWLIRTCEIIDRYKPRIIYFDWWIQREELAPYLRKLMAYYYNRGTQWGEGVVINYKHDAVPFGLAVPDVERGQFAEAKPFRWQSDTAMCFNSWSYTLDNSYKKAKDILCDFTDIISKNGTMLLNIGPKEDGTFSDEETAILKEIGGWMDKNHEAVFEPKPYRIYGEGPTEVAEGGFNDGVVKKFTSEDFRFLSGNGCVYIFLLGKSEKDEYTVKSFAKKQGCFNTGISGITVLATGEAVKYRHDPDGLLISFKKSDEMPAVLKLDIG